jgi:AcrR family transcriptional regulator
LRLPPSGCQNSVLAITNAIPDPDDVAGRIARQTLAKRGAEYATEVRRLLDAATVVMKKCGTKSRPRVSDIVAAAGLSNDAFYRHFPSKDALVRAILEDGADRLGSYLAYQMSKEESAEMKVRRWVAGVLAQADDDIASTTLAVLWNGAGAGEGLASGRHFASTPLATLLQEPFAALGSEDPELDASLAAHATLGRLSDYLWRRTSPSPEEIELITRFCLRAAATSPGGRRSRGKSRL